MILADKIMEERKRNGWSQEEFAEQLGVSRQSVSKWESAQSVPDLNRILQMAEIFGVSTDYLLKDEMERKQEMVTLAESVETAEKLRSVSMEEASEFLKTQEETAPRIALAVSLCVLSPVLLIVLAGFSDSHLFGISENLAGGIGITALFIMVAIAVFIFIQCGAKMNKFEFLEKKKIETAYGVDGMVRSKKEAYASTYSTCVSVGVILCILSVIPLIVSGFLTDKDYIATTMVGVLLVAVSVACYLFVSTGTVNDGYNKLLQEGDYTTENKKSSVVVDRVAGVYWLVVTAIYLAWSFLSMRWDITWIVWPVAGVLFGAIACIVKIVMKVDD